jgi:thiazolylpeptide-type bacteriocin precursor
MTNTFEIGTSFEDLDIDAFDINAVEVEATVGYLAMPENGASCCGGSSSTSGSSSLL